jgi:hypothetical protein
MAFILLWLILLLSVRFLKEEAHTQKVAEAAVGFATDNGKRSEPAMITEEESHMID